MKRNMRKIVKGWEHAEKAGITKTEYCRERGTTRQTLLKAIKETK